MPRNTPAPEPVARLSMNINGRTLNATKWEPAGWVLSCSWADLVTQYQGCDDLSECLEEFTRRATAAATTTEGN